MRGGKRRGMDDIDLGSILLFSERSFVAVNQVGHGARGATLLCVPRLHGSGRHRRGATWERGRGTNLTTYHTHSFTRTIRCNVWCDRGRPGLGVSSPVM